MLPPEGSLLTLAEDELLNQSAATLSNQLNQAMAENQTLLVSLEQAKLDLKLTQQQSSADATASLTKLTELQEQLKKLEAKHVLDIAATKHRCQLDYQSLLNTQLQ